MGVGEKRGSKRKKKATHPAQWGGLEGYLWVGLKAIREKNGPPLFSEGDKGIGGYLRQPLNDSHVSHPFEITGAWHRPWQECTPANR